MVFSIPRTLEQINFGSWNASEDDEHLYTFRSDSAHWRLPAKSFKLGFLPVVISGTRYLSLDPAYPDMYLPSSDFKTIGERINTLSTA